MSDWAPQDVITRMGTGMRRGEDLDALVEAEKSQGLLSSTSKGLAVGGLGGGLLGRLHAGEAATKPIGEILRKGLGNEGVLRGLRGLAKIPTSAKALALGGAGLGALAGGVGWATGADERGEMARSVARGLRREHTLQSNANLQTQLLRKQLQAMTPVLHANETPTASAEQPLIATVGKT
jgi:hypothetical protein